MEKLINNAPFALVLVFLVIGFVLLIKGADFFVEGSSSVAKRLHVPSIIIGLTIVAMGTSLPETAVSVSASITGNNERHRRGCAGNYPERYPPFPDLCRSFTAFGDHGTW